MAIGLPFTPTTAATTGTTVALTTAGASATTTVNCTAAPANNILVTADPANTKTVFVRMSGEAAPTAVIPAGATLGDVPLAPGASRVLMNPRRDGVTGVAIVSSAAATVYFTPGEGGT